LGDIRPAGGQEHLGSSTWQSLARRTGSVEADWLNGEIVLRGRLAGFPTPVNALLQRLVADLAVAGGEPGSLSEEEILARLQLPDTYVMNRTPFRRRAGA
jgi:2-dehydropantoate 2-reductase